MIKINFFLFLIFDYFLFKSKLFFIIVYFFLKKIVMTKILLFNTFE